MAKIYDAIVLGCGGVGTAALYHLARRGLRVLGIDRFPPGHDRGSSHGETRIIRQAYFEHADYVPLLKRAYELWAELADRAGERLYFETGLLQVGPPDGMVIPGVLRSAAEHGLAVERLAPKDVATRFPGVQVAEDHEGVFEQHAGYLLVERCVLAHAAEARKLGAEIRAGDEVTSWTSQLDGVTVTTSQGEVFHAAQLIIAAGAWSGEVLRSAGVRLRVLKKHLHWLGNNDPRYRREAGFPAFLFELPEGVFYGFPQLDAGGLKVGEHTGGEEVADPLAASRERDPVDLARVQGFVASHLPGVAGPPLRHISCFYTMSADEHFIVDRHPLHQNVVFAAGLSGHGFKFTCVLGEALAQLAMDGRSTLPIGFLGMGRPGLQVGWSPH